MTILNRCVLVSFANGVDENLDQLQHLIGGRLLSEQGCDFTEVEGRYKGVVEKSYAVHVNHPRVAVLVSIAALRYKQESVLSIDQDGNARLVTLAYEEGREPQVTDLGKLVPATAEEVAAGCDYTKYQDQYFKVTNEHVLH